MIIALRHVLAGIGAAAPEELPPVPYASVSRWDGDDDRLRLAVWGDTAHLTSLDDADRRRHT
ncbi:hypothetical protein [Streptomyces mutabilis]|uniref:hypothetical protein n=1 Tax=Streptomyces mutabilis TaxID=67332 RepID=UPI0036C0AB86